MHNCATTSSWLIEAHNVGRSSANRVLLDRVSIQISGGDRVGLVGPTGSGKSLFLRALAMLDPLDCGQILWRGRVVRGHDVPEFRSRIHYLQQRPVLLEGTVESNLRQPFSLKAHRGRPCDLRQHLARLAPLSRDDTFLQKDVHELSGGESQIVALLRAIQLDPEVLLLDEPTSGLDRRTTEGVERLVHDWFGERPDDRAIIWVTHDLGQAQRVVDCVLRMEDGSLNHEE